MSKKTEAVDPVVAGCLDKLRRGDVLAAYVLADHLEEIRHPLAGRLRKLVVKVREWNESWERRTDFTRCRRVRWERIAANRRYLRREVASLFGRKWRPMPLEAFK